MWAPALAGVMPGLAGNAGTGARLPGRQGPCVGPQASRGRARRSARAAGPDRTHACSRLQRPRVVACISNRRRAPRQVALGRGGGAALDAWSLGCVLAELALQRPLFPAHAPGQLLAQARAPGARPQPCLHAHAAPRAAPPAPARWRGRSAWRGRCCVELSTCLACDRARACKPVLRTAVTPCASHHPAYVSLTLP